MKKFLSKVTIFIIIGIAVVELFFAAMIISNLYLINLPGNEIYYSIKKSKKRNNSKILLLGDSVGRQLFPNKTSNDSINSLACNQAIGMIGQYILLNNYLKAGNRAEKVFMLFTPFSFRNNLDQIYTYHYFLKPFYNSEYTHLFTETVNNQITKIPYHKFTKIPHIHATTWAPYFKSTDHVDYTFLSPISIEYLNKIKKLSFVYDFDIIIMPTPTSIEKRDLIEKIDTNEFTKTNLTVEFSEYFEHISYLDSSEFSDGSHLINPEIYAKKYRKTIIQKARTHNK